MLVCCWPLKIYFRIHICAVFLYVICLQLAAKMRLVQVVHVEIAVCCHVSYVDHSCFCRYTAASAQDQQKIQSFLFSWFQRIVSV